MCRLMEKKVGRGEIDVWLKRKRGRVIYYFYLVKVNHLNYFYSYLFFCFSPQKESLSVLIFFYYV